MPRRRDVPKRKIIPDPKYKDKLVSKFTNTLMFDGKKAVAEGILYGAFDVIEFWIDDCLLIELVTPELGQAYRATLVSEELRQRLAPIIAEGFAREGQNVRPAL